MIWPTVGKEAVSAVAMKVWDWTSLPPGWIYSVEQDHEAPWNWRVGVKIREAPSQVLLPNTKGWMHLYKGRETLLRNQDTGHHHFRGIASHIIFHCVDFHLTLSSLISWYMLHFSGTSEGSVTKPLFFSNGFQRVLEANILVVAMESFSSGVLEMS